MIANAIEIQNVTKTFGSVTAVNALSLTVPRGSVYGFIGPNGSGKTTTLRMIMRIFHPDEGHIRVFGQEQTTAATDRIGYLPEERGLYKKMKVRQILQFYARLKGMRRPRDQVDAWLQRMKLSKWADKNIEALSKGMSQKVQFIAAVVTEPELVILDEPFTGLDPVNVELFREVILDLRHRGTTVIFSTHDMAAAERMCDYIFMIFRGQKVLDDTLESIQANYATDTIRLRCDGGAANLADLAGIEKLTDYGKYQELRLRDGADSQSILAALMSRTRIQLFELTRPSLQDIFLRIAGPEAEETQHV